MKKYCKECDVPLELVLPGDNHNLSVLKYMICPVCDGTYNPDELERCDCKYAHKDGICRWPTLEGRLSASFGCNEKDALLQLQQTLPLSEYALERLEKLIEEDKSNGKR